MNALPELLAGPSRYSSKHHSTLNSLSTGAGVDGHELFSCTEHGFSQTLQVTLKLTPAPQVQLLQSKLKLPLRNLQVVTIDKGADSKQNDL
jgi:hypothetical protein